MKPEYLKKSGAFVQNKGISILLLSVFALLIGYQIYDPSKRVVEAAVGIVFLTLIAKYPLTWSLSFFIIVYPFPFALKVGSSNVVFLPVMIIIWLVRVTLKNVDRPTGSILDKVLILMTITYIISFYNNPGGRLLTNAVLYTLVYLTGVSFFYLIVNFARDEESLKRVLNAGVISCFFVMVYCILEMIVPGRVLVPGWIYTHHRQVLIMKNIRIAGPFSDYELLAEYLALNIPIFVIMFVRTKRLLLKYAYAGLALLAFGLLMATSTRGAFISLTIGVIYMLIVIRRDLNIVRITGIIAAVLALAIVEESLVAKYTISGGMFRRLFETKFVGYIPDTRTNAWPKAWARAKKHIIIGHSPAWDMTRKIEKFNWPHNCYLYYWNVTGVLGLISFLLLLFTLLRSTIRLRAVSMFDKSFPRTIMLILHIMLVIFMIDQFKIDYMRNLLYIYFIWFIFGLIAAAHNVIMSEERQAEEAAV